jgi:hypothetical protein
MYIYIYIHTYIHTYIYIYIYMIEEGERVSRNPLSLQKRVDFSPYFSPLPYFFFVALPDMYTDIYIYIYIYIYRL